MSAHVKIEYGERATPVQLDALYNAFAGITIYADPLSEALPALVAADPDLGMVTDGSRERERSIGARWPGVRDALHASHPVAALLRAALAERPDAVPLPDPDTVSELTSLGCVATGKIVSFNGVPVPAGEAQTAYYIVLRYRALFSPLADPARIYQGDVAYDAAHVTDEMQQSILLVSTRIHRDNLVKLQQTAPGLFLAIWMREAEQAEALVRFTRPSDLPPCYPRSRFTDQRKCLMIVSDAMHEFERTFDLMHALRFIGGVTRTSVRRALESSTCMTDIYAVASETNCHVAAGVAHVRSLHPSMNAQSPEAGDDAVFASTKHAFDSSRVYADRYRHVTWIAGDMPVRFFLGIEPTMLVPVALIQMRETMVRHEGKFWLGARGKQDGFAGLFATRLMSLAIIITSNICLPTARAMTHDDGLLLPTAWTRRNVAPLISNPIMAAPLSAAARRADETVLHDASTTRAAVPRQASGDRDDFKNSYAGASHRASLCSSVVGQPGWTQGFRQDAWRQPDAEIDFLRDCCRYVLFDAGQATIRDGWNRITGASAPPSGPSKTVTDVSTGLPRQHPLECVQDWLRDWFDPLQVPSVKDAEKGGCCRHSARSPMIRN